MIWIGSDTKATQILFVFVTWCSSRPAWRGTTRNIREQSAADHIKYSDAEREAGRQKIGLWHDPHPVPPWDYRQAERELRISMEPFVGKSTVW